MRAATPGPSAQAYFNFAGYNPNVSIPSVADCYSCHDAMACSAVKSAVLIPAVRKGLCNQRVRMVQDVMLAHLFGAAAGTKCPLLPQWPGSLGLCVGRAAALARLTVIWVARFFPGEAAWATASLATAAGVT